MKYKSFTIKNYKGIENLVIDLTKFTEDKVFTFIGLNESGKTTILEAINFAMNYENIYEAHSLIPKNRKANFSDSISVETIIEVDNEDNERISNYLKSIGYIDYQNITEFSIVHRLSFSNSEFIKKNRTWGIDISIRKKGQRKLHSLHAISEEDWLKVILYIKSDLMPRILYFENFLFDIPEKIYIDNKKSSDENEKYKSVLQDVIHDLFPDESLDSLIVKRLKDNTRSSQDALDSVMLKISKHISTAVFTNWENLFRTNDTSIKLQPAKDENNRCYIEFKIQEGDSIFYISERSLGFRWFFTFLFFTLFRKHRKTDLGETLFLLDEPASNLHSTAQKKLLKTFETFVEDKCKLLYTTHSHHLVNPKWLNSAYIVKNNAVNYNDTIASVDGDTKISAILYKQFVAKHPDQQDYFKPILDTLDYQPGLLEKIPNIIITEGKNDYYTLRYMNEVYFNGKYKKLNLFPGMGCAKNSQVIALYMSWSRKFLILLDSDKAGEKSQKEYLKLFGDIIKSNIATYEDITPPIGKCAMEDIFNEDEKLRITKLFNPNHVKYNKSAFNSKIMNLLIENEKIELSSETEHKFKELLDKLNKYQYN